MAVTLKCILSIFITLLCLEERFVLTCSESCECYKNLTSCSSYSYNMTLKINRFENEVQVNNKDKESPLNLTEFTNKTFTEIKIKYDRGCKLNIVDFKFPFLNTYSISFVNNSIVKLRIRLNFNKVQEINLSSNKLGCLDKGIFGNFTNLRMLFLRNNQIAEIFRDSFVGLSKLETLDLSDNYLTILTNVFTPLKSLQHLNISRNKLEFLHENYFNNWLLQHLDVSYNNLRTVAPGALQQLPNLARLLLTDNPHLGITQLDTQLLVGTGRRLQQIDASRTGLYQVPEAFTHSVRFLSLVGNNITSIRCGDLDSYPLLQSLDFSDNKIASIEDDSLGRLEMLIFLNINKNYLRVVPKSLPDELKYLSICNNIIRNLTIPDFKNLHNLQILLLKSNKINYIENNVFDDLLSLEMLDLSNNPIKYLSSNTFDGPLSLRDLRLCHINISMAIKDGSFPMSSPESVQMLHLQGSPGLAHLLLADSAALAAFTHLQYLDLRMNNISTVRNDLLFYLVQLKTLRLHGNLINCSNETWLNDWMNWNKSISNGETCYYSTSEAKLEINKYNCTFPETFTISDSLPPVNLYSTEMINKLLRYYGYLNNKTGQAALRIKYDSKNSSYYAKKGINDDENGLMSNSIHKKNSSWQQDIIKNNDTGTYWKKEQTIYDYLNKSANNKFKNMNVLRHKIKTDVRLLDNDPHSSQNSKKDYLNNISAINQINIKENDLNKPMSPKEESHLNSRTDILQSSAKNEAFTVNPDNKLEYSPYQSTHKNYAEYIGTASVMVLVLTALILWVSFRSRFKRRQVQAINSDMEDQIEVSNISGGVLW